MERVFISYAQINRPLAEGLCTYLEQHGIRCWIAPRDIPSGVSYAGEITRAIKSSDIMVAVFSREQSSEHVKNEVNLAFSNGLFILPYCLDDIPLDDDLEYWLSARQRIFSSGRKQTDFERIERVIREHRGEVAAGQAVTPPSTQGKSRKKGLLYIALICVALIIAAGVLFFLRHDNGDKAEPKIAGTEVPEQQVPETVVPQTTTASPASASSVRPVKEPVRETDANTFTGTIKDGYPDGFGTYTFRRPRRIDMHDSEGRMADAGDYIVGNWTCGHLNYGEWYGADGVKKAFIQLGEGNDTTDDQKLGRCVRP